eukprot:TCONS_00062458-protein
MQQKLLTITVFIFAILLISTCDSKTVDPDKSMKKLELMRMRYRIEWCKHFANQSCDGVDEFFTCWQSVITGCTSLSFQRGGIGAGECTLHDISHFVNVCWHGDCMSVELKLQACYEK